MADRRPIDVGDIVRNVRKGEQFGVVTDVRPDHCGGSGCYYEIQAGIARFPEPTPVRDELLVEWMVDGAVSWTDSKNVVSVGGKAY